MEPKNDEITARIGIFSGRPNPQLSFAGKVVEEFAKLVKLSIGKETIHPPPPPRLGFYYGFRIRIPTALAERLALSRELNIYSGVITEKKGREEKHWRDTSKVEDFLIRKAYEQDFGEWLQKVGVQKSD
jgi:hypothetical protein